MVQAPHILVVVDPTAASQPALDRAARIAAAMGWRIELLVCIHDRLPRGADADPKTVRRTLLGHQLGFLKELARGYPGREIFTKAVWDRPLHEAIIRETLRSEPRMVMKDTHYHGAISRATITNTDWHLIRDCPTPLWLVRGEPWCDAPRVVAFVDPTHEHDKPADLDRRILLEAVQLARGLGGEAHAVHCCGPGASLRVLAGGLPGAGGALAIVPCGDDAERDARLAEVAAGAQVPAGHVHLRNGPAAAEIPAAAAALNAGLAVMGAVSRSRLQQAFLGNTAEQVLEQLACDVLVIKPAHFQSQVTFRAQPTDFTELH